MSDFSTGGSAVVFATSGTAVSFSLAPATDAFTVSPVTTPGAHASTHGAGGSDPITTLGTVTITSGTATTFTNTGVLTAGSAVFTGSTTDSLVRITQTGAGEALRVEDSTNPDSTPLVVTATGNVGVGIASPEATLHVKSAWTTNEGQIAADVPSGGAYSGVTFQNDGTIKGLAVWDNVNSNMLLAVPGTSGKVVLGYNSTTAALTMDASTANVGIGTVTPATKLHVNGVASVATGAATAPSLTFTGDTNTGIYSPGADQVGIAVGGASGVHVATTGVVVGGTTVPTAGYSSTPQLSLVQTANDGFATWRGAADSNGYNVAMHKTRNATPTSHTIVAAGDQLGNLRFYGSDGSAWVQSVIVRAAVDGTPGSGDVPGYFAVFTKPTGGAISEKFRIDNAGLITGTGTSLGAWTSYTPTLGGTGWALGDGTLVGRYCQIGKVVHFQFDLTFGSTSTYGGFPLRVSVPVTAAANWSNSIAVGFANDASAAKFYLLQAPLASTTEVAIRAGNGGANMEVAAVTTAVPFTWASGDYIRVHGAYEAA